jgi:hypothetical protein
MSDLSSLPTRSLDSQMSSLQILSCSLPETNKKRTSYQKSSLKYTCQECGKTYKHVNCLQKHLWIHSEYWQETSKLGCSKHQQVLLLEAASALIQFGSSSGSISSQDGYDDDDFDVFGNEMKI